MLALGMFVSMLVAVIAVQQYNNVREANAERAIVVAEAQRREQSRVATCTLVKTMLAAYEEPNGPITEIRQNVIDAWRYIGNLAKCTDI